MKQFISTNMHWILVVLVAINLVTAFINFNNTEQDMMELVFGVIALLGVCYLAFHMEIKKRKENK